MSLKKVTFKNVLEEDTIFTFTEEEYLVPAVYEYARNCGDDELYDIIVKEKISLFVNNECIHPDDWAFTKLEEDTEIVITPQMGKGVWGAILTIVIGAALMIFAPYLSGYLAGTFLAMEQGTIFLMGLAMALGGISSLLFRPDLPSMPGMNDRQTQTYNWSGIKTMARCDSPIPIIYGTHKVGGNLISAFTEARDNDNYLYMLIALGEGEIEGICQYNDHTSVCVTEDPSNVLYKPPAIEINDQPLHYYDNVTWSWRRGSNVQIPVIGWFNANRVQYDVGREVRTDYVLPDYQTTKEVDAVTIHVYTPALFDSISSPGSVNEKTITFYIQYKKTGTETWYFHTVDVYGYPIHTALDKYSNYITDSRYKIGYTFDYAEREVALTAVSTRNITVEILNNSQGDGYSSRLGQYSEHRVENTIAVWVTDVTNNISEAFYIPVVGYLPEIPYYYGDGGVQITYGDPVWIYTSFSFRNFNITMKEEANAGDRFFISVPITEGQQTKTITGKTKTGIWKTYDITFGAYDSYDIRIRRTDGGKSSQVGVENNLIFQSIIEIVHGEFSYPNTALLGLRIKATDQLSGGLPNITTTIKGKKISVPYTTLGGVEVDFGDAYWDVDDDRWENSDGTVLTWDGSTYVTRYSDNSMLCVKDLLLNTRYGLGDYVSSSDLYSAGIVAVVKDCHKSWQPTDEDRILWWNTGLDYYFSNNITVVLGSASIDASAREVILNASTGFIIDLKIIPMLTLGETYKLSVTLADLNVPCRTGNVLFSDVGGISVLFETKTNLSDGTYEIEFTSTLSGYNLLRIGLYTDYSVTSTNTLSGKITNVSLERLVGSKLHYHTYNGVLESGQAALTVLLEMCDSFRTWPVWYDGKFNFVVNKNETPVHVLTKSNTESFSQSFTPLSEIPYRLIGQFADIDIGYDLTSLIAQSVYATLTKTNEKTIGLKGIIHKKRAERELKFKLNQVTNCTHAINVKAGIDSIHATAGDIILIQDDLPQFGYGGRVLDYNATALEISVSEPITLSNVSGNNIIKYQLEDNSFATATINASGLTNYDIIKLVKVQSWPVEGKPKQDGVYTAGILNSEGKLFRITAAQRTTEDMIEISGIEHLPELYTTEPTIRIIDDQKSDLPNPLARPSPPTNISVNPLPTNEGLGFELNASAPADGTGIIEIVVKLKKSTENDLSYTTIATIPAGLGSATYKDNSLELDTNYILSFQCRNATRYSIPVYIITSLNSIFYTLYPPTGIRLKNYDQNNQTFKGKDITIEWNPVEGAYDYVIEVHHTSVVNTNILRTVFVSSETYTYTYENMIDDSDGAIYGTSSKKIIFRIATRHFTGMQSSYSTPFAVYNLVPAKITGLFATSQTGAVKFQWNASNEVDHRSYVYNTKVGNESWSNTASITDNTFTRTLTASEIETYRTRATIYFRVKDKDWYEQVSLDYAEIAASANLIADNLFQMFITSSNGAGTLASLIDAVYNTGGITIS